MLAPFIVITSYSIHYTKLYDNAVQAYENGEYRKSAELFGEYQHLHDSPQVRYNRANALYMSGHYQEAVYWYGQVFTNDVVLKERTRSNLARNNFV